MSHEWTCKHCVKENTDACYYREVENGYKYCKDILVDKDIAYQQGRADALKELVELMKPCNNCSSYPNECNHTEYFEDCCRTEQSISWEDLRIKTEQLKSK